MRKIAIILAAMLTFFILSMPSAFANSGIFSKSEFFGLNSAFTQSQVSNWCGCTGSTINRWYDNGRTYKQVDYDNKYQTDGVMLTYVKHSDGVWYFYSGVDCTADGCFYNSTVLYT